MSLNPRRPGRPAALPPASLPPSVPVPRRVLREGACAAAPHAVFDIDDAATDPAGAALARRFCLSCPVRALCREYAVANEPHGIWGGLDVIERFRLRGEHPVADPWERQRADELRADLRTTRTMDQVAAKWGVCVRTLERWLRADQRRAAEAAAA